MKQIKLSKGKFALVDDEDFEYLNQWKWYLSSTGYAVRNSKFINGQRRFIIRMHRFIIKPSDNMQIDHINGDKLDNRKCNLRICTQKQNVMNQMPRKNGSSKYKGVDWNLALNKWRTRVNDIHIGYFESEVEAAKQYNKFAIKYFGEFSKINNLGI